MGLFERRSSRVGLEEADSSMSPGAHDLNANVHRISLATAEEDIGDYGASAVGELPESMESVMHHTTPKLRLRDSATRQLTSKFHTAGPEAPDGQSPLRHAHHGFRFPPHSSNTSRASSAKTSSSSLQALNEETVIGAHHSDPGTTTRTSLCQNLVQHAEPLTEPLAPSTQPLHVSGDFPVYPDQSYAVLQSQVHPPIHPPPSLRSRSSYPLQTEFPLRDHPELVPQGSRTAGNTPISSPGLFSARSSNQSTPPPPVSDDETRIGSPYLHPTHLQQPKETHTVELDRDLNTGNKLINDYEILEELGRGEHGKVKLGRHLHTKQRVAIKIVQRYSKRRRLGKLGNPEDKVKKEVAILKKARHPNVVSLLEVIDDPNRQKVYIVLEYVENGEIVWRKKGLKEVVHVDKRRFEREKRGIPDSSSFMEESQQYVRNAQFQRRRRERGRDSRLAHTQTLQQQSIPAWSLEHGGESDDELGPELSLTRRPALTRENSDAHSDPGRSYSPTSDIERRMRDPCLEGSMYGPYVTDYPFERRYSVASSNFGYASSEAERLSDDDDMSFVPCLTIMEARNAFRDSVLGLEYLHYQGIIHRDIKPANLLVTANHRVKISDFGVSYLGRPIRDDEEEQVAETDATELDDARELSKTVGTPAFYAPELCYTGDEFVKAIGKVPKISGAIDIWSLGVTLYGMIFGRLPFVSDDEFSMFQTIVKSEVFIPRKRLKPVEDDVPCLSCRYRVINSNKRTDDELVYEDIDDELHDLLKRLLTKDPARRITIKEIKYHPWVLRGLPNPTVWIEESDPSYQSKGKKIEVSSEEVTSAVSKVPFIQRVRSNVAKLSGYIVGRREGRKRTPSTAALSDVSTATLQSNASVKDYREGRRVSLRGDEEVGRSSRFARESEHPLSQSFLARTGSRDDDHAPYSDQDSNCDSVSLSGRTPRPRPRPPGRAVSTLSNAESTMTVRPSAPEATSSAPLRATSVRETSGPNVGGLFSGAGRRLTRQPGERRGSRTRSMDRASVDGDGRSDPSLALSPASATGRVELPNLWREEGPCQIQPESPRHSHSTGRGHRRDRSRQLTYQSSTESLQIREILLRQSKREIETISDDAQFASKMDTDPEAFFIEYQPLEQVRFDSSQVPGGGLSTSPPSAVTISSSSADDYTSGMSQSASHPSIPSVMSGASSISGDAFHSHLPEQDKEGDMSGVPPILRTGDTVKASSLSHGLQEDEESIYYCDDEDDESEDEGLIFGKKKSAHAANRVSPEFKD